jgi:3-dehydroquinate synthase
LKTLDVGLGERTYPIHIGRGVLAGAGELIRRHAGKRAVIVTNATVAAHHLPALTASLRTHGVRVDVVLLPDGEAHKTLATLDDLLTRLLELRVDRSTTLVALGGGIIGDIAGFAAAVFQRGIPFVQVPTTLLAQVDSSVGGKTGVNHPLGKNMIGAFWQPRLVLIDTDCLATLPDRELHAGMAEVIKHAVIRDAGYFSWLEANIGALLRRDADALTDAIHRSCEIKAADVAADERETGERALLNFGHTFGHAIETDQGYGTWLHGEAVAAGMVCAARLSQRLCGLAASQTQRLADLLAAARLPIKPPTLSGDRWLDLMRRDKKVDAGAIRVIALETIGRAVVRSDATDDDIVASIAG